MELTTVYRWGRLTGIYTVHVRTGRVFSAIYLCVGGVCLAFTYVLGEFFLGFTNVFGEFAWDLPMCWGSFPVRLSSSEMVDPGEIS